MTEKKNFDPNSPCLFCNPKPKEILAEADHALLIIDTYPASLGHCLVIPRRHMSNFFDCTEEENRDFRLLILKAKEILDKQYTPDAYNIGSNNGLASGQSVFHLHIHIIPRYQGDVDNPKGGVRWVVPKNSQYKPVEKTGQS